MKTSIVLFGLLFGLVALIVNSSARPNHGELDLSTLDDGEINSNYEERDKENNRRGRRTRHSRHIFKRYDYPPPWSYDRDYLDLQKLYQIEKLIEELREPIKSRQQVSNNPLQVVYIPIPIYLNMCSSDNKKISVTNVGSRGGFENENENVPNWVWDQGENTVENDDDGARPISFKPVNVNRPQGTQPPPVEHGSIQAGVTTTAAPLLTTKSPIREPNKCEAAILTCCRFTDDNRKKCFDKYGCVKTFETGLACTTKAIQAVILHFKEAYGPR
ncbi:uncharacterized protein [Battus philenor]|uniref:uncharacterized protein isoform X1 n=1 Tax=Battus philenor TaxID=42288 RepID=UPI0035CEB3D3